MRHRHRSMLALTVAALLWGAPASAQSITVGGQIIFEDRRGGFMNLFGENFTFDGVVPAKNSISSESAHDDASFE